MLRGNIAGVVITFMLLSVGCEDRAVGLAVKWNHEFDAQVGAHGTQEDVLRFLNERHLSAYIDTKRHLVTASRPNIERHGVVTYGIYLTFHFDIHGTLLKHEIAAVGTGP